MPVWAWVLMIVVGLLLVAGSVHYGRLLIIFDRMRNDILERGDDAQAWVVEVKEQGGITGAVPLVLVSPDRSIPDDEMRGLVARLQALRKRTRKPADAAEREVLRLTRSEDDNPGRERLPDGFTGGHEVYSLFMNFGVDDEANLPPRALESDWFHVRVIWDEYPSLMAVPPRRKRRR